jgi:hypothetical protein
MRTRLPKINVKNLAKHREWNVVITPKEETPPQRPMPPKRNVDWGTVKENLPPRLQES